jgi:hypothetical protein
MNCKYYPTPTDRTICAQTNLSMNQVKADGMFKILVVAVEKSMNEDLY